MNKQLTAVILYGIVAVIWLVRCGLELSRSGGTADGLTVLAALAWCAGFLVLLRRYLRTK